MAHILIVEDDALIAECLQRWLQSAGHVAWHVRNAQDAIDSIDSATPHVIVLDLLLSGASGVQLLHTLQSHVDLATIPIIVCSNAAPQNIGAAYGVRAVLRKSTLTRQKLCAVVQEALFYATV